MAVKLSLSRASVLAGAALLSACASSGKELTANGRSVDYEKEIGVFTDPGAASDMDPIAAASFWGSRYNQNPRDVNAAVAYSVALRKIRSNEEAVKVVTRAANANPDHHGANLEAGRALVEAGRAFEAVRFLEKAEELNPQDWRTLSAFGVALGVGQFGLLFLAMRGHISPGVASVLIQAQVPFTVLLAAIVRREHVPDIQYLALAIACCGVGVIAWAAGNEPHSAVSLLGIALVLAAAAAWAVANLVVKSAGRVPVLAFMAWSSG